MIDISKVDPNGPPEELIEAYNKFVSDMNDIGIDSAVFTVFLVTAAKSSLVKSFGKDMASAMFRKTADYIDNEAN